MSVERRNSGKYITGAPPSVFIKATRQLLMLMCGASASIEFQSRADETFTTLVALCCSICVKYIIHLAAQLLTCCLS